MKALLIFNSPNFKCDFRLENITQLDFFPLGSDWEEIDAVALRMKDQFRVEVLKSAEIVNDEVISCRNSFIEWAAAIGNLEIKSKSVRDSLLLPDGNLSAWWFGLLADKDPSKSPTFLRIVQTGAILKTIQKNNYEMVILALDDSRFQKKLQLVLKRRGISWKSARISVPFSKKVYNFIKNRGVIKAFYSLFKISRKIIILKKLFPIDKRMEEDFRDALLFFTYFPSVSNEAKNGRFENKFAMPLQKVCSQKNMPIVWVLWYASFDGYSFRDSVVLAKKFFDSGEKVFFYEEFLDFKTMLRVLYNYFKIAVAWTRIRFSLNSAVLDSITGNDYSSLFLMEALDNSFYGDYLMSGTAQYQSFKNIFTKLSGFSRCLYYCEMMSWEYALIAAKRFSSGKYPVIGYQHSAISLNYLHMYHSREELKCENTPAGIPMPEILAVNGPVSRVLLKRYYDNIENIEAVRYLYIKDIIMGRKLTEPKNKFVLMICTNIEPQESSSLIKLIKSTFPRAEQFEIWFKGHPALSVEKLFADAGIDADSCNYKIKEGSISDLLPKSDAVMVGASTVSIEALAFGCEVLVYLSAESLSMSPLVGFEQYYSRIYDPESLRAVISDILTGQRVIGFEEKQKFVREYWNLNQSLDGWKRVLGLSDQIPE